MASFNIAIAPVLKHEGGYNNHPSDPGGATNYGITLKVAQGFGSMADFNNDGVVNAADMKVMPLVFALKVYETNYWNPLFNSFPQPVADKVLDMAVHMGPSRAAKLLQQALGLTADGVVGPRTVAAVGACSPAETRVTIRVLQRAFYTALIKKTPSLFIFRNGWMTRADY